MAIEKNSIKVSRLDSELSSRTRESMSSEDDEFQRPAAVESDDVDDDDDEFDDCDSGAGSDDFDLLEFGETGEEFCQIGDQTCSIPFELYDLPGLGDILSMDVWNDVLTDEERISLAKYLPDMEQDSFMRTMKELFTGCNFHFGVPINKLFAMLKGGLCEPRVALYRQGLGFFQKHRHYHVLRKHQNTLVTNVYQIRDAWLNCRGYSIEEKLRVLNIMKSQKSLMYEQMEELESDTSEREESGDGLWSNKKAKDWKQKRGYYLGNRLSPTSDFPSQGRQIAMEPAKLGAQNPKGTLKVSGSKFSKPKKSGSHLMEVKLGAYGSASALSRHRRDQFKDDDEEETMYEVTIQRDQNLSQIGEMDRAAKKYDVLRGDDGAGGFTGMPMPSKNDLHPFGRTGTVNQLSDIKTLTTKPSNARFSHDYGKKLSRPENIQQITLDDQMKHGEFRAPNLSLKRSQIDISGGPESYWYNRKQGESHSVDWSKSKKGKTVKDSSGFKVDTSLFNVDRTKQEKGRNLSLQSGGRVVAAAEGMKMLAKGEETESDSSEQFDEDDDDNPLMRSKWAYPHGVSNLKSGADLKNAKFTKKDKRGLQGLDTTAHLSRKNVDFSERLPYAAEGESFTLMGKQKGKRHDSSVTNHSSIGHLEDSYLFGASRLNDDGHLEEMYRYGRDGQLHGKQSKRFHSHLQTAYPPGKWQKGEAGSNYSVHQPVHFTDYISEPDSTIGAYQFVRDNVPISRSTNKGPMIEGYGLERSDGRLLACNSVSKKRKVKGDLTCMGELEGYDRLNSSPPLHLNDVTSVKQPGKRKSEDDSSFEKGLSEHPIAEVAEEDVELESKSQKKPFILITPTVHTGFSFSIIHLLSAVRLVMTTPLPEDSLDIGKKEDTNGNRSSDGNNAGQSIHVNAPSLTIQEIVNRVKSNPGDPCILETQEPLQDLVRGVLKIFSSRTAPLGAKGWKALVAYEKSTKSWSWVGPITRNFSDHEAVEEVTSPDAWGLPHKMLVKLVDSFANWLKSGQETLQQIGSLPAPPLTLMQQNLDEKERFRDLRAQKSLNTINPSSEDVRAYFRREEVLRYSIPDRSFSYTALDGRKSAVAPSRKGAGKPTSKARDHFMLKRDRPPHVTILCLVRDAAARLPGSIGTRADVCTLIRDSQYIVEDVSDAQVNQIVSGALDRLHYERDPCVQFDAEKKLWVYLHREREEEDFEDDGTSSTKKWKRQKKESADASDLGAVNVAYNSSDLNVEPSGVDDDKREDLDDYDDRHPSEDNVEANHSSEQVVMPQVSTRVWDAISLNPMGENKLLCQQNFTNENFGDEAYGREDVSEYRSTSLS